jgi:hypothetical protein
MGQFHPIQLSRRFVLKNFSRIIILTFLFALLFSGVNATAQFAERGSVVGSGNPDVDASGRSVKNPRVRAVHSMDPDAEGGTSNLILKDPYLAYQLGRNLNFREFRERDGVFGPKVANLGGPKLDGTTAKITANNHTSCLGCHNLPNGNPGGGANFSKDSGFGRNTPHYYGGGIMEMLAIQVRASILRRVDTDGDGWISAAESQASPGKLRVAATPGNRLNYGTARLDGGATGVPGLNQIFRVWYGKQQPGGAVTIAAGATGIDGTEATHYNFEMVVWGWGQLVPPSALNPTNRAFLWDPYNAHSGLEAYDPSTVNDPDGDGVSEPTVSGAIQFPATHTAPDPGSVLDPNGNFSLDDPDGDGILNEISEGDLDLAEHFMLNAPRPAFAGTQREYRKGVSLMNQMDCTSCHVESWKIRAGNETFAGDRRMFDFDVTWNNSKNRLEGALVPLFDKNDDRYDPQRDAFLVDAIFTDLRHHEMGQRFQEKGFDGSVNTVWRTPPLWGAGSGFPWGHDGKSLTLRDVILRHGGEALESRREFASASPAKQQRLIAFLERLQLYDIETLPADIDGNGVIERDFVVAGKNTGRERFNAEWLFENPAIIQGNVTNVQGITIRSFAIENLEEAYGLDLELRRDSDLDGWPDVWDAAPTTPGFGDGEQ